MSGKSENGKKFTNPCVREYIYIYIHVLHIRTHVGISKKTSPQPVLSGSPSFP